MAFKPLLFLQNASYYIVDRVLNKPLQAMSIFVRLGKLDCG